MRGTIFSIDVFVLINYYTNFTTKTTVAAAILFKNKIVISTRLQRDYNIRKPTLTEKSIGYRGRFCCRGGADSGRQRVQHTINMLSSNSEVYCVSRYYPPESEKLICNNTFLKKKKKNSRLQSGFYVVKVFAQ